MEERLCGKLTLENIAAGAVVAVYGGARGVVGFAVKGGIAGNLADACDILQFFGKAFAAFDIDHRRAGNDIDVFQFAFKAEIAGSTADVIADFLGMVQLRMRGFAGRFVIIGAGALMQDDDVMFDIRCHSSFFHGVYAAYL